MKRTKAADAFARLSTVLTMLQAHPAGLRIDYLAQQVGVAEAQLRRELLDFYTAETLTVRPDTIVFSAMDGSDLEDPADAEIVQVVTDKPAAELGVELMTAEQWLNTYEQAAWMAARDPHNEALAQAVAVIAEKILGGATPRPDTDVGQVLSLAIAGQKAVDVEYSRTWKPGVVQRRIEPVRLFQTRRGWEVDALTGEPRELRTFVIERIRSATLLARTFDLPADIEARVQAHRKVTDVDLSIPQRYQWLVDRYAESVAVLNHDEETLMLRADFLPPVAERVGLILVTAPESFVIDPKELNDAAPRVAQQLWEQHHLDR